MAGVVWLSLTGGATTSRDDAGDFLGECFDAIGGGGGEVLSFAGVFLEVVEFHFFVAVRQDEFPVVIGDGEATAGSVVDERDAFTVAYGV